MTYLEKKALREETRKAKEIARQEKHRREKRFDRIVTRTESLDLMQLKEEGDKLHEAAKAREDSILQAFNDKKLKSKALIKEAIKLKGNNNNKNVKKKKAITTKKS